MKYCTTFFVVIDSFGLANYHVVSHVYWVAKSVWCFLPPSRKSDWWSFFFKSSVNGSSSNTMAHICCVLGCRNKMGDRKGLGLFHFFQTRRKTTENELDQGYEKKALTTHKNFLQA